jgi:hypothetical protein
VGDSTKICLLDDIVHAEKQINECQHLAGNTFGRIKNFLIRVARYDKLWKNYARVIALT